LVAAFFVTDVVALFFAQRAFIAADMASTPQSHYNHIAIYWPTFTPPKWTGFTPPLTYETGEQAFLVHLRI
jgi:hypothetical protein